MPYSVSLPARSLFRLYALTVGVLIAASMLTTGIASACGTAPLAEIRRMTDLINAERAARNLPPVRHDPRLSQLAQQHACDMVRRNFFSHTDPRNVDFFERMRAAGMSQCQMSENLAMRVRDADHAHRLWMGSHGHRNNILRPVTSHVGLGIAVPRNGRDARWVTVFAGGCRGT